MRLRIRLPRLPFVDRMRVTWADLRDHYDLCVSEVLFQRVEDAESCYPNPNVTRMWGELDAVEYADVTCTAFCMLVQERWLKHLLCNTFDHKYASVLVDVENGGEEFECRRCGHTFYARF